MALLSLSASSTPPVPVKQLRALSPAFSPPFSASHSSILSSSHSPFSPTLRLLPSPLRFSTSKRTLVAVSAVLQALIFDCDGVILESENLHRQAYNDAFAHFNVRCSSSSSPAPLFWDIHFYDQLQNQIGGGKPKMRWYFKEHGWPTSTIFETPPETDADRAKLIDILQDWKTERYQEIIKSGSVQPRPGVLRLMDEAKAAGKKLAVCSAATKSSVILTLESLIGLDRFQGLDCFLAGDDVKEKKPDPSIYIAAAKRLGVSGKDCLVVEDSVIGLQEYLTSTISFLSHILRYAQAPLAMLECPQFPSRVAMTTFEVFSVGEAHAMNSEVNIQFTIAGSNKGWNALYNQLYVVHC